MKDDKSLLPPEKNEGTEQLKIEILNDDEKEYDKSIKVILLGDTNVGKSSVIDRLKNNPFNYNPHPTLTLEHYNLIIKINNFILRMQIWDTAGQEKFDSITSTYYKSTDVAIFVYAINDEQSFNRIPGWIKELEDKNVVVKKKDDEEQLMIKILIGNKTDLEDERKVTIEEGENFYNNNGFSFFTEISCKENQDEENNKKIKKIIESIGKEFYAQKGKDERLNSSSYIYEASKSILNSKQESKSCQC